MMPSTRSRVLSPITLMSAVVFVATFSVYACSNSSSSGDGGATGGSTEPVVRRRVLAAVAEATLAQAAAVAVTAAWGAAPLGAGQPVPPAAAVSAAEPPGLGQPAPPAAVVVHPSVARPDRAALVGEAPVGSLRSRAATTLAMWAINTV
jgi:hypothetical protein